MKRGWGWGGEKSLLFTLGKTSERRNIFFDMGLETQVVFEHTDPRGGNSMNRIPEAKPLGVWMGGLS